MAADFPDIPGPAKITGAGVDDPFLENTFESGDEQVRPIFTKPRRKEMTLTWDANGPLTLAQKNALVSHRETVRGDSFSFTHPVSGVVMTCRYVSDGVTWDEDAGQKGLYQVKAVLKEIV
jgi:hypothetical protein